MSAVRPHVVSVAKSIVLAGIVNVAVLAIAAVAEQPVKVMQAGIQEPTVVPLFMGFVNTFLSGAVALGLALLLRRFRNGGTIFAWISGAVLVATSIPPFLVSANTSSVVWLMITHVIAAFILIPPLFTTAKGETGVR